MISWGRPQGYIISPNLQSDFKKIGMAKIKYHTTKCMWEVQPSIRVCSPVRVRSFAATIHFLSADEFLIRKVY